MSFILHTGLNSHDSEPLRIAGADGVYFELEDGRRLIDASNTAGSLGHRHPRMVEAIREAATSPVINEGWLWPGREQAATDLVEIAFAEDPDWVGAVRFCLSGSEANDLALSLAQAISGRDRLVTRERAYHGMTGLAREVTVQPHWHGGLSSVAGGYDPVPAAADVAVIAPPRGGKFDRAPRHTDQEELAAGLPALDDAAAVILDYTQGGIYHLPDYQDTVAAAAREAGTLWIADEVVTGFGRAGGWFGFQRAASRPDIVTLGKPVGAGAAPVGAVVLSRELLDRLDGKSWQTYSTFRGHPLSVAAVCAHLETARALDLPARTRAIEPAISRGLGELAARHPSVRRVDGDGLHWTVELDGVDWRGWHADSALSPIATRVADRAAEHGALFGTSGEPSSLFISPPLIIEEKELEQLLHALDVGLELADAELVESGAPTTD